MVVDKMARLVIDRALTGNTANTWPRWTELIKRDATTRAPGGTS
jgi:hypothetical protein